MTPPESPLFPLFGAMESSSSKKITQGAALLARVNTGEMVKSQQYTAPSVSLCNLTFSHILFTLTHIHVDQLRALHTVRER